MPSTIFPFHTFRRKSTVGVNSKLRVKGIGAWGGGELLVHLSVDLWVMQRFCNPYARNLF